MNGLLVLAYFFFFYFDGEEEKVLIDSINDKKKRSINVMRANKGEWSELYAFYKMLATGRLYLGDLHFEQQQFFYPILEIPHKSIKGDNVLYRVNYKDPSFTTREKEISIVGNDQVLFRIALSKIDVHARLLLDSIKKGKGRSFRLSEADYAFLRKMNLGYLKADSSKKADANIILFNPATKSKFSQAFSIKSFIGGPATLMNASNSTMICYKIENRIFTDQEIEEINSIDTKCKLKDRINRILFSGATIQYDRFQSDVFYNNLLIIDSRMPEIIAACVLTYYSNYKISSCEDIVRMTSEKNPFTSVQ